MRSDVAPEPHAAPQDRRGPSHDFSAVPLRGGGSDSGAGEHTMRIPTRLADSSVRAPAAVYDVARSPGRPLDPSTRLFFESRFGQDLSRVRVNTDARAQVASASIGAYAYAVGHNIVFGRASYSPSTPAGRRLLAHELAHTIEAPASHGVGTPPVSRPNDAAEHRAEKAADAVMAARRPNLVPGSAPAAVRRRILKLGPAVKGAVLAHGRGELGELVDNIVEDGKFHRLQAKTIGGVEHVWEVKTVTTNRDPHATFAGAMLEKSDVVEQSGTRIRHQKIFVLALVNGQIEPETVLHELIHLRISIDKDLPPDAASSFARESSQQYDMATDPALGIVTGMSAKHQTLADSIDAFRQKFAEFDGAASAKLQEGTAATDRIIEFLVQERYVNQTAGEAFSRRPSNATVARRYTSQIQSLFEDRIDARRLGEARRLGLLTDPPVVKALEAVRTAVNNVYDEIDREKQQAKNFQTNPPGVPPKATDHQIFENRPVGLDGKPVPLR
jgi:hypothetical protein